MDNLRQDTEGHNGQEKEPSCTFGLPGCQSWLLSSLPSLPAPCPRGRQLGRIFLYMTQKPSLKKLHKCTSQKVSLANVTEVIYWVTLYKAVSCNLVLFMHFLGFLEEWEERSELLKAQQYLQHTLFFMTDKQYGLLKHHNLWKQLKLNSKSSFLKFSPWYQQMFQVWRANIQHQYDSYSLVCFSLQDLDWHLLA